MKTVEEIKRKLGSGPGVDGSPVSGLGVTIAKAAAIGFAVVEGTSLAILGGMALSSSLKPRTIAIADIPATTIVLPSGRGTEAALNSLLQQPFVQDHKRNIEIILSDVKGRDNSTALVKKHEVEYNIKQKSSLDGRLSQFGIGVELAEGDVVVLASPSLRYGTHWLHRILSHFEDPGIVGVTGGIISPAGVVLLGGLTNICRPLFTPSIVFGNCAFRIGSYKNARGIDLHLNENFESIVRGEIRAFSERLRRQGPVLQDLGILAYGSVELVREPVELSVSVEPLVHLKRDKSNTDDYLVGG